MMQLYKYVTNIGILRNVYAVTSRQLNSSSNINSVASYSTNSRNESAVESNKELEAEAIKKNEVNEYDDLYKSVLVEVRGHDPAVLKSYERFVVMAADHLECPIRWRRANHPYRFIERWTLLKSRFSNRKHMRQYEMRTYFTTIKFAHLTGSTCDTLLEYIQRNLPEGVAMHVFKTKISPLPEHYNNEND